ARRGLRLPCAQALAATSPRNALLWTRDLSRQRMGRGTVRYASAPARTVEVQLHHQCGFDQAPTAASVPDQQPLSIGSYGDKILMRHRHGTVAWHYQSKRDERLRVQCLFNGLDSHAPDSIHRLSVT